MSQQLLSSWTAAGPNSTATRTYDSVKAALGSSPELASYEYEVFLQGSYANATNIDGDSDIDVIVMFHTIYQPETERLSPSEMAAFQRDFVPATITRNELRDVVHRALNSYYGSRLVESKNKCLRVAKREGYLDADVVPCIQHRRYVSYPQWGQARFVEGVSIKPQRGSTITNFPKEHRENGRRKNELTHDRYKPTVRQLKRLKRLCAREGLFDSASMPGYVLECLAYNVPNSLFDADDTRRPMKVLAYLAQQSPDQLRLQMKSCDEIHRLFVDDPGQHDEHLASRILKLMWERL